MTHSRPGFAPLLSVLTLTPLAAAAHGGSGVHLHPELLIATLLVVGGLVLLFARRGAPAAVRAQRDRAGRGAPRA